MGRIFIEGFESGGGISAGTVDSNSLITGTYCANSSFVRAIPNPNVVYVGVRFKCVADTLSMIWFYSPVQKYAITRRQTWIGVETDSLKNKVTISVHDDMLTTYDSLVTSYDYYFYNDDDIFHLQVMFQNIDATNKRTRIKCDGHQIIDVSYANSIPDVDFTSSIDIHPSESTGHYFDDIVIDDADWPGETEIHGLVPVNDTLSAAWVGSGSVYPQAYENIDETPSNTTDYIYSSTPDAVSLFDVENLPVEGQTIKCVQVQAYASCMSGESFRIIVAPSGEAHFGNSGEMSEAYEYAYDIWDNNPATSGEWTFDEIQTLQIGAKLIEI